jgi:hypothetical protein
MTAMSSTPEQPQSADQSWRRWAVASSLLDALADEFYGVNDLVALTAANTPGWIHQLAAPPHWHQLDLSDGETATVAPARTLVWGPRSDGGWDAADTVEVYGYTGLPSFGDVLDSTARSLRDLDAHDLFTHMVAVPAIRGVAAERSTGVVAMDDRRIWIQLTNYVAGSSEPHAGRLIVHSLYVAESFRHQLVNDIAVLTGTVQDTFTALATAGRVGGG